MALVVGGSASPLLSRRLSKLLGCRLVRPEFKKFPDGEMYIRIREGISEGDVLLVQSTGKAQNENLVELLLLTELLKDMGAGLIRAVVPYMAYARQDRRFRPGEALSAKTVCRLIESSGADEFITVDVHHEETLKHFSIRARNLTAMRAIGAHLKGLRLKRPLVLGADRGAAERARTVALEIGADHDFVEKKRLSPDRVKVSTGGFDVRGRDVVIVDDIISTGGTMAESARALRRMKARSVCAACAHAVLTGNALERMRSAGIRRVIGTDTIECDVSAVSVAPIIHDALR
ncbi:MAG: ribose-phosphate diphosphokinase [Candidatus Hadarchaeales archaeon]